MMGKRLAVEGGRGWRVLAGVGGIGTGIFFALDGEHTLGRNESRPGRLLDVRDYCKLHIIAHYASVILGAKAGGEPFRVLPIGKVGEDEAGRRMADEMRGAGMDVRFVKAVAGKPTLMSVCFQYPDGSGGNITTQDAAASALGAEDIAEAEDIFAEAGEGLVVLAAPEVSLSARKAMLEAGGRHGAFRAAAFAGGEIEEALEAGIFEMVDLVALNEDEAGVLAGREYEAGRVAEFLVAVEGELLRRNECVRIVVSAGREGAWAYEGGRWGHRAAVEVEVASTAGAGDALFAGVIAGLAAGLELVGEGGEGMVSGALDLGVLLAGYAVTSVHTIHPEASVGALVEFAAARGMRFSDEVRGKIV